MIDLSVLERRVGTARTLAMCQAYIREHRKQKSALLQIERGKGPKGSNRRSGYLKARRECDKAFSAMIRRQRTPRCFLHEYAKERGVILPTDSCNYRLCVFHLIGKAESEALRFDPLNVVISCTGANKHEMHNRAEWRKALELLMPDTMKELHNRAKFRCKRNEAMLRAMTGEFNKA